VNVPTSIVSLSSADVATCCCCFNCKSAGNIWDGGAPEAVPTNADARQIVTRTCYFFSFCWLIYAVMRFYSRFMVLISPRWSSVKRQLSSTCDMNNEGVLRLMELFETAKELLVWIRSSNKEGSGSSGGCSSSSSIVSGILNLNRLFSAFASLTAMAHSESSTHPSAAAAAAADANYDIFSDTLSLATATRHALLTVLRPPAAAALVAHSMLRSSIRTFESRRANLLRGTAATLSPATR
jgi:hypothetical protein